MADDVIYTEPVFTERAGTVVAPRVDGQETDWSGWQAWLDGHINIAKQSIRDEFVEVVGDLLGVRDVKIRELELKLAECAGGLRVLRTGKLPRVMGTFIPDGTYELLDIVALDGSSFVATKDAPGPCPGDGWQLMARAGSRGARGHDGPRGERGASGESGERVLGLKMMHLDTKEYVLSLIMNNGQIHSVDLREMLQQFLRDLQGRAPNPSLSQFEAYERAP